MARLYSDNAATVLANAISNSATTIVVPTGKAAVFPVFDVGNDYAVLTITQAGTESVWEQVKLVANDGAQTLTVERGFNGTQVAWSAGAKIELRFTSSSVDDLMAAAATGYKPYYFDFYTNYQLHEQLRTHIWCISSNVTLQSDMFQYPETAGGFEIIVVNSNEYSSRTITAASGVRLMKAGVVTPGDQGFGASFTVAPNSRSILTMNGLNNWILSGPYVT